MQFIDEAKIIVKAGNGGHGCVSFRREKFIERGGPDGGDGGNGGNIIFRASAHLNTLLSFRYRRHFKAENGQSGRGYNKTGKSAQHLILEVPIGTQIYSEDGRLLIYDFTVDQEEYCLIQGGKGGLGNLHFKSSTNRAPRTRIDGVAGEELEVFLKMKLLSNVGLIGLPNVGKSTFLSVVTNAKPKIADYHFTTIAPNLGIVNIEEEEFVISDIPGLIEGASQGKGLGDRFLKHIERCQILLHLLDATNQNIEQDYLTVKSELSTYLTDLSQKTEIICLNKIDMLDQDEQNDMISKLGELTQQVIYPISNHTTFGIKPVLKEILRSLSPDGRDDDDNI